MNPPACGRGSNLATPIEESLIARHLAPRARAAHKGDFGRVLIVGGGRGMPGAVRLCAEAALRGGAGRVSVATFKRHTAVIVGGRPELMCHEVEGIESLPPLLAAADVVVVGPGLGKDPWARALFASVLGSGKRLVVDADGLNLLAEGANAQPRRDNWVLTPHPGEAARLLQTDIAGVQADREGAAHALLARYGGTVVLKGAGTLVAAPGQTSALCTHGNPGMATAGMGDVLSGVIAAMLAQIGDPWDAVRVAVIAHAMAGDRAARQGERGLIASDVIAELRACVNPRA